MVHSSTLLYFSDKQKAYAGYLLQLLGHVEGHDTDAYLEALTPRAKQYITAGNTKSITEKDQNYYEQIDDVYQKINFTVIDYLHAEYQIKKNKKYKIKENIHGYVTATDLANYVFCPVGYSIARTLQGITTTVAKDGTSLHELSILKADADVSGYKRHQLGYLKNESNTEFFDDINSSEIIYSGHTDEKTKYFVNEEKKFVGDPDYVFTNKNNENFIVEEKFMEYSNKNRNFFYNNHKVQLASYIKYLTDFRAKYGYLVYWHYENDYGNKSLVGCHVLKIVMNYAATNWLESKMDAVVTFKKTGSKTIDSSNIKASKCGGCAHSLYCGHKNKRSDQVSFPYSSSDHKLYPAEYPEILKKT